jgi:hypothetical protein
MPRRAITAAVITLTVAAPLAACNNNGSATPPPFTPSTVAPTSTTPSTPNDPVTAAAEVAYRRFIEVKDATAASGGKNVADLPKVATGAILGAELNQAATFRAQKWHSVGRTKVLWTKPLKLGSPSADGSVTVVTLQACYDSAEVTAVDATGKSVKKPGTPTRWLDEMQMHLVEGAWKAYFGLNKAAKC